MELDPGGVVFGEHPDGEVDRREGAHPHRGAPDLELGVGERLALLARQEVREGRQVGLDRICHSEEHGAAVVEGLLAPIGEGGPRRGDGGVEILGGRVRRLGEDLLRRGVHDAEGGIGRDGLAVDQSVASDMSWTSIRVERRRIGDPRGRRVARPARFGPSRCVWERDTIRLPSKRPVRSPE